MIGLNPIRFTILAIGLGLSRLGLVEEDNVYRVVELAWPRILTGIVRMSRTTADIVMVGITVGSAGIAGVGFAAPYSAAAFIVGGGLAAGAVALISQGYGAGAYAELGQAVRSSTLIILTALLPVTAAYWTYAPWLISLLSSDAHATRLGANYLRVIGVAVPFAGLNLLASRALIGADDAWTAMVVRSGGAILNLVLNALFIFVLRMGIVGAALGSVLATMAVTLTFTIGLVTGRFPGIGRSPISVRPFGSYIDRETMRDLTKIGLPVVGRNMVLTVARFPMLAVVGLFGSPVVAAYVISWRIARFMNTPGWGFGLAASSLIGQSLGKDRENLAESVCYDILYMSVATFGILAAVVLLLARPIVGLFVAHSTSRTATLAVPLVYAACIAVVFRGITSSLSGALDASGDTTWQFYGRTIGMFGLALPLAYLGASTSVGLWGLYLAYIGQTIAPAAICYYRFSTGAWKVVSREYRPTGGSTTD